jgi:hypothetical protein
VTSPLVRPPSVFEGAVVSLSELVGAVDGLCNVDPPGLADAETVVSLQRQLERLTAVATRAVAAFDAGRAWEADGARTCSAWLAVRCRVPVSAARRRVQLGRVLRHLPAVEAAWLAGAVGEAQVRLFAAVRTPATAEVLARDEAMLVEQAQALGYRSFVRALAYWAQLADPEGTEAGAEAQYQGRKLHLSETFGGSWALSGRFDPIGGAIVSRALGMLEQELFEADWAEAKERFGADFRLSHLARTPAQRRADALVEMARRSLAVPAGARVPEPLFTVLVGYETFAGRMCELANGAVVSPGSLLRWLDRAELERVVFDGPSRVTDVGVRRRLFAGATRRAVEVRDRECFHPYCDLAAGRCEIDHVQPWAAGGPTTEANGRVACGFHNRERHRPRAGPT